MTLKEKIIQATNKLSSEGYCTPDCKYKDCCGLYCNRDADIIMECIQFAIDDNKRITEEIFDGWTISEPEPEPEPDLEYEDCPIEQRDSYYYFRYNNFNHLLHDAVNYKLIGYVYADGLVANLPVRYFEEDHSVYHYSWKEGYKIVRPIAVRIEK